MPLHLPNPTQRGQSVSADGMNRLAQRVKQGTLTSSSTVKIRRKMNRTALYVVDDPSASNPRVPKMKGGNYIAPAGGMITAWANPGAPTDAEIEAALLVAYSGLPVPTAGDFIQLWPSSAGYLSVLCVCIGVHGTSGASRFIHISISAVQYDFFVAGATST